MNTKLTLNLDKHIIDKAKDYAKNRRVSLSQLIENYLNSLTRKEGKEPQISPFVQSLTGVIPNESQGDYKKDFYDYLNKKYS